MAEENTAGALGLCRVLICDFVGLKLDENGVPDCREVRKHIEDQGGVFHAGSAADAGELDLGRVHFFYLPHLSTEAELLEETAGGAYDGVIAAATVIPRQSPFRLAGVRIGAGTGNMQSASWGGGDGQGGNAELIRDGGISGASYKYNSANAPAFTDRIQSLISGLNTGQTFDASTQLPASSSVMDYAKNSVSWLEALRQSATAEADYRSTVAQRATTSLSQATGVNLDEEMTNLLDLERTFQASSRLINTVNEMLSTLIQSLS